MKSFKPFLLALLLYLPTLVLVPQVLVYIVISTIGIFFWLFNLKNNNFDRNDWAIFFFVIVSVIIYFVGKPYAIVEDSKSLNDFIPYAIFILTTISFSKYINRDVIKYVSFLILIETLIGIIQYIIGVPYFIEPKKLAANEFGESEYLYYNKVYGLSVVSSVFSLKILVGVLLFYYLNSSYRRNYMNYFYYFILGFGLIVTFNRTSIVACLLFFFLLFIRNFRSGSINLKILSVIVFFGFTLLIVSNYDLFRTQFFRGQDLDMSGRDFVFPYYLDFINENFYFGNFGSKHWVELTFGRVYHAHNSFLQTFANMGVILGGFLLLIIFLNIDRTNYIFILPILVYSLFQYGILWGVSFLDVIFFYFLFNKRAIRTIKI